MCFVKAVVDHLAKFTINSYISEGERLTSYYIYDIITLLDVR